MSNERRPLVAGNWKMNLVLGEARQLVRAIRQGLSDSPPLDLAVCPPFVYLMPMCREVADSPIALGAQNVYCRQSGAFTGEVAPAMLKDAGCTYVILGHSERRHVLGESDELINRKLRAALAAGLTPIFCVGETLDQRDAGQTEEVVARQITAGVAGIDRADGAKLVIAYEPVWAIGTGRNATPEQAQEVHQQIRGLLGERFGRQVAQEVRIQYGGSVKPGNAADLMSQADVDGALVGGASLKADDFLAIIQATIQAKGLGKS